MAGLIETRKRIDTMNRFFTRTDLLEEYRLPKHVHDQLLSEVVPVETDTLGEPLFLEAHVDAWLTARYTAAPWRSGCTTHVLPSIPHIKVGNDENCFVTVAEAQRRYLAGERSKRWWYRMAKIGRIAHHRVGDSVLFRTDDIEKFIAESRKAEHAEAPRTEAAPAIPVAPQPVKRQARRKPGEEVGFKFFPR
jgi:hypothetical protein